MKSGQRDVSVMSPVKQLLVVGVFTPRSLFDRKEMVSLFFGILPPSTILLETNISPFKGTLDHDFPIPQLQGAICKFPGTG